MWYRMKSILILLYALKKETKIFPKMKMMVQNRIFGGALAPRKQGNSKRETKIRRETRASGPREPKRQRR